MNSNGSAYVRSGPRPPAASSAHRSSHPDVPVADEYLRDARAAAAARDHLFARAGHRLDVDLLERDPLLDEERAGAAAVRTPLDSVHHDSRRPHDFQAARAASGARERQVVGTPGGEPPAQRDRPREPLGGELAYGGSGEGA